MKDRVVEFPGRYRDKISGQLLDLVSEQGTIEEPGTPICKETLLTDQTAMMYELDLDSTVNDALVAGIRIQGATNAFLTFVTNVNTEAITAAFGKNRSETFGLGLGLIWYCKYKEEPIQEPECFQGKDNIDEICEDPHCIIEIITNVTLTGLMKGCEYAWNTMNANTVARSKAFAFLLGASNYTTYDTDEKVFTDEDLLLNLAKLPTTDQRQVYFSKLLFSNATYRTFIYDTLVASSKFTSSSVNSNGGGKTVLDKDTDGIVIPTGYYGRGNYGVAISSTNGGSRNELSNYDHAISDCVALRAVSFGYVSKSGYYAYLAGVLFTPA